MSQDETEKDLSGAAQLLPEDVVPGETDAVERVVISTEPAAAVETDADSDVAAALNEPVADNVAWAKRPGRLRIARPRDPLLLRAEAEEAEAAAAEQEMAEARRRVAEAEERAEAARVAAAESRAEVERLKAAEAETIVEDDDLDATRVEVIDEAESDQLARDRALGKVAVVEDEPEVVVANPKRTTDKFWASLGLFLLRIFMAGLTGLWGYQCLVYREQVETALGKIGLQVGAQNALAITLGIVLMVMSVLLLLGCGTRIVAGILAIMGGVFLAFFRFGPFNPIMENQWGFYGDYELLITLVAFLFVCMGGGGWSVDYGIRRGRERKRAEAL